MLTSKNKRNKKILMMALQGDSQINQNSHLKRKELLKKEKIKESDTIPTVICTPNCQNSSVVEELLPKIQPFQELLPDTNINVNIDEEPFALPNLIGDSFKTLEEISADNFTELVAVPGGHKEYTVDSNLILLETPTFEQSTILECYVSTVNNNNENLTLINHTTTTQVIQNNNTKEIEIPMFLSDNNTFKILEPIPSSNDTQREETLFEENPGPSNIELPSVAAPDQEENGVVANDNGNSTPLNNPSTSGTLLNTNSMKRKRSKENQRALNKKKRMEGQKYLGFRKPKGQKNTFNDTERNERKLLPRCNCSKKDTKVTNSTKKCYEITEADRQEIFKDLWSKMNWDKRKVFVSNTVFTREPKRKTTEGNSRRSHSLAYHLQIRNHLLVVCKTMYLNTTGLGQWSIADWSAKSQHGVIEQHLTAVASRAPRENSNTDRLEFLKKFVTLLNKLPSHYCRKTTNKLYLEQTFTTYQSLYNVYKSSCENEGIDALTINKMKDVLSEMNVSLFRPRKDQCDVCLAYTNKHLTENEYEVHQNEKKKARDEKNRDKTKALNGGCHVLTMDVQAVKLSPMTKANALYYRTKLCNHNFTIYNLATNDATCNWFDETISDGSASTFASFLVHYLESNFLEKGDNRPIIIFSDGCTAQNRNVIMSNALLSLAEKYNVEIIQKYLTKGHSQMECDSVHSTIENALKNRDIYLPSYYHRISQEARKRNPYEVFVPTFDFFHDYGYKPLLKHTSIRPGRSVGDPVVVQLKVIKYTCEGIFYKLQFDEDYRLLPHRPKNISLVQAEFPKLHSAPLSITERKFKDLQEIKNVIPRDCWPYYDSLPHHN